MMMSLMVSMRRGCAIASRAGSPFRRVLLVTPASKAPLSADGRRRSTVIEFDAGRMLLEAATDETGDLCATLEFDAHAMFGMTGDG